jgi:tRNA pseudouridine55 synthase
MAVDGVIVVDKPSGWTSHDVVSKLRRLSNTKKVGHLGTLDPIATGVLPVIIGRATRLAQFFTRNEKTYEGVIRFGYATDTYDRAGVPLGDDNSHPRIEVEELNGVLDRFRGTFAQTPPPVSAKKVGGVPAYKLARKNQSVELQPVTVTVHELDLLRIEDGRDAHVRVRCSAGTYVRGIAHEAGQILGCGAFLLELRRTASGEFTIDQARSMDRLAAMAEEERLLDALVPSTDLLPAFPVEMVDPVTANQIRQGRDFRVSPFRARQEQGYVKAVSEDGQLIAIAKAVLPNVYHPVLVL